MGRRMIYLKKIQRLFNRFSYAWRLANMKDSGLITIILKRKNVHAIYNGKAIDDIEIIHKGLHTYIVRKAIKSIGNGIDDAQLALDKATFDIEAGVNNLN